MPFIRMQKTTTASSSGNREEIADNGMTMHRAENRKTHHCLTNHYCELDGDTAHTETYFVYFGAQEEGPTDVLGGRYLDDLERRDGEWRISRRLCFIEWSSSPAGGCGHRHIGVSRGHSKR